MSTKIHTGFRLTESTDLFPFIEKSREVLNVVRDRLDSEDLAKRVALLIDEADLKGEARPAVPLVSAFHSLDKERAKEHADSVFADPNYCEIFFYNDFKTGQIYGVLNSGNKAYWEVLQNIEGFEEFGYWNNTDHPDRLTQQEWDNRRDIWDRVISWNDPLSLKFVLRDKYDPRTMMLAKHSNAGNVLEYISPARRRARLHALNILVSFLFKTLAEDSADSGNSQFDLMRMVITLEECLPTNLLNLVALRLADYTVDDLLNQEPFVRFDKEELNSFIVEREALMAQWLVENRDMLRQEGFTFDI